MFQKFFQTERPFEDQPHAVGKKNASAAAIDQELMDAFPNAPEEIVDRGVDALAILGPNPDHTASRRTRALMLVTTS